MEGEAEEIHRRLVKPVPDKETARAEELFLDFLDAALDELDVESFDNPEDWLSKARERRREALGELRREMTD